MDGDATQGTRATRSHQGSSRRIRAVVVPYERFLERRAWRAKMAVDQHCLLDECVDVAVICRVRRAMKESLPRPSLV
jgi:hypothetical protein